MKRHWKFTHLISVGLLHPILTLCNCASTDEHSQSCLRQSESQGWPADLLPSIWYFWENRFYFIHHLLIVFNHSVSLCLLLQPFHPYPNKKLQARNLLFIPSTIQVLKTARHKVRIGSDMQLFGLTYIDNVVQAHVLAVSKLGPLYHRPLKIG